MFHNFPIVRESPVPFARHAAKKELIMLYPLYPKSKWPLVTLVSVVWIWSAPTQGQPAKGKPNLTCAEMEQFLRDAKIGRQRNIPKGVTLPKRATLTSDDGRIVHDASIQTIHESKTAFTTLLGS